jgi:hypothetical protein
LNNSGSLRWTGSTSDHGEIAGGRFANVKLADAWGLSPTAVLARVQLRISAIVDACFRLIADAVSAPSWTRRGCAQAKGSMYLNRPSSV